VVRASADVASDLDTSTRHVEDLAGHDVGRVARASLDCVEPEPLPAGHWLYTHPRVRLSAHISWSAPEALEELILPFVENLRRYRAGEPLEGVVDLEQGY